MPVGSDTTPSGTVIPGLTLTRRDGWAWSFTRAERDENDGVQAQWHDQTSGRKKTHSTGGDNPKRLKRVYASEADAKQAADAEAKKRARGGYRFEYDLAQADCRITPGRKLTLSGWGSKIDAVTWLVDTVETTFTGRGIKQKISLESAT